MASSLLLLIDNFSSIYYPNIVKNKHIILTTKDGYDTVFLESPVDLLVVDRFNMYSHMHFTFKLRKTKAAITLADGTKLEVEIGKRFHLPAW